MIDYASKSKGIFKKLLENTNKLKVSIHHLKAEVIIHKQTFYDLRNEMVIYREKDQKQAGVKIKHLEDVVAKLNEQLKI